MIQKLVTRKDLYHVRVTSTAVGFDGRSVLATLPACLLAGADFREIWQLHTDAYGNAVGVDFSVDPAVAR